MSQTRSYPTLVGLEKLRSPWLFVALERIQSAPQPAPDTIGVAVPIDAALASRGPFKAVFFLAQTPVARRRSSRAFFAVVFVLALATFVVLELDVVVVLADVVFAVVFALAFDLVNVASAPVSSRSATDIRT